jgi:hypothetical protein
MFGNNCSQTKHSNPTTSKKTLPNAKQRMTHKRGTCGLGFSIYDKNETQNGWRCLDEKNKMEEKSR